MVQENSEAKFYTLEEIAKHNGKEDTRTWIIIKDQVYDVTDFMDKHPGGGDLIEEWAGKDATKEFVNTGHSGDAKTTLKTLKIGEVVKEQRKNNKKVEDKWKAVAIQKQNKVTDSEKTMKHRSCLSSITCGIFGPH